LAAERLMAWLNSDTVTEATLGDLLRELHASPTQAKLLGLDERTVGDQHVSLAETDGGRIHHARETVTEESVCPSICFVGPFV
jgi:hypothetical protein